MVVNVDELKGRVAKPKFVPRNKRNKLKLFTKTDASKNLVPAVTEKLDVEEDIPQWRRDLEANLQTEQAESVIVSWSDKPLSEMTERDWRVMTRDLGLELSETSVRPLRSWHELPGDSIRDILLNQGYSEPTPVQRATIPLGLAKKDVIGIAETGSGKTVGFVVPLVSQAIAKLNTSGASRRVSGIVLAPTRELAQQITVEARKFSSLGVRVACVVGGHDLDTQAEELAEAQIVVATPGRLLDVLGQDLVSLAKCETVVLDEADRMVDMGFEEQVTTILGAMPRCQTLMFSATWPKAIELMAARFLRDPARVTVGGGAQANRVNDRVTQRAELVSASEKLGKLRECIGNKSPVIVFVNQKLTADEVSSSLAGRGIRAAAMHGDLTQSQREAALSGLRNGSTAVLVATDVAGRGIDIPNVQLVVNYDMPRQFAAYVHRVGRTGRAGRRGLAISLVTAEDRACFAELKAALRQSRSPVPDFLNS